MPVTDYTRPSKPFLLGVAGGSGSGKTFFARDLIRSLGELRAEIVFQDNFYIDQSKRFDYDGGAVNFDDPLSIDFDFLARCVADLKAGRSTEIPIYDFSTHTRRPETLKVEPKTLIVVDGILVAHAEVVRNLFDDLIFFYTPEEVRYQRRLERDVKERGRTPEGVRNQFYNQVKPMHDRYVEPSRRFARHVVSQESEYRQLLERFVNQFQK